MQIEENGTEGIPAHLHRCCAHSVWRASVSHAWIALHKLSRETMAGSIPCGRWCCAPNVQQCSDGIRQTVPSLLLSSGAWAF